MQVLMLYFLVSLLFISCNRPNGEETKPTEGRMTVYADRNIADLVTQLKLIFERNYPNATIDLQFLSDKEMFTKFMKDSIGIMIGYHKLNSVEKEYLFKNQQNEPREFPIAVSAIAFISSEKSKDSTLVYEQLMDFIRGESSSVSTFNSILVEDKESGIGAELLRKANVEKPPNTIFAMESKLKILEQLQQNPNAMAAVDWTEWSDSDRLDLLDTMSKIKVMLVSRPIDSTQMGYLSPYQYHLAEGFYPFTREISVVSRTGKTDVGMGFASFIAADIGQKIVLKAGLLPKFQSDRWIEMIQTKDIKVER